jgi:hypothetical protein
LQPDVGLALTRPSVQRFWRANKRIHLAGRHETVSGGRDAVLIRFEAVATSAAMEVVSAVDTYQILHEVGVGTEERSDE